MDTIQEHTASQVDQIDLDKLTPEQIDFLAVTMIREGFIQEADRDNLARIKSRWAIRMKTAQVSAKELKGRETA